MKNNNYCPQGWLSVVVCFMILVGCGFLIYAGAILSGILPAIAFILLGYMFIIMLRAQIYVFRLVKDVRKRGGKILFWHNGRVFVKDAKQMRLLVSICRAEEYNQLKHKSIIEEQKKKIELQCDNKKKRQLEEIFI